MKTIKILCFCLAVCCVLSLCVPASIDPFAIQTSLSAPPPQKNCAISVARDEILEFTAADFERRLELSPGALSGITVTSLPPLSQGELVLDGVEVDPYEFLSRADLDRLCFVPNETAVTASLSFIPQGKNTPPAQLSIHMLSAPNNPPSAEGGAVNTLKNVPVTGTVNAFDPDGGALSLQLVQHPKKGSVTFDGLSFTYSPFKDKTGADSFTVCAVDAYNAYSPEVTVSVVIEKARSSFSYADMQGNPSQYAALKLHEAGVYTGQKMGDQYFFEPDRLMSRGEFLVLLLSAAGMQKPLPAAVNTGLPNDAQLPLWLKPYVKKAIEEDILSDTQQFRYGDSITRAEAVVYTGRASKISDVKEYPLAMRDASSIPDWARRAYTDLSAYRMLDLYDGSARPASALTNSYAADLCWQLYKHCHR